MIYTNTCYVKDNNKYGIYYSFQNDNSRWGVALVAGDSIDTLKGVLPVNRYGNLVIDRLYIDQFNLKGNRLALNNKNAFFQQDEIRFDTQGDKQVRLINTANKILELRPAGSSWSGGIFRSDSLQANNLRIQRVFAPGSYGVEFLGATRFHNDEDNDIPPWIKMLNVGIGGAGFKIFNNNIVDVVRDSGERGGHLRSSSVIFDGSSTSKEGEIRYNKTTKKHQGYDGTTWHNLY